MGESRSILSLTSTRINVKLTLTIFPRELTWVQLSWMAFVLHVTDEISSETSCLSLVERPALLFDMHGPAAGPGVFSTMRSRGKGSVCSFIAVGGMTLDPTEPWLIKNVCIQTPALLVLMADSNHN